MARLSKCPVCQKSTNPEHKPFCSHRCKDVDLARWFRGDYSVPATQDEFNDEAEIKDTED
jgi:uncharacterized protein